MSADSKSLSSQIKKYLLTQDGFAKLQEELKVLVNDRRKEVIERIREAASHGDLSENADYSQAREEQSFLEGRIQEIEEVLRHAEIIAATHGASVVVIGSAVTVKVGDLKQTYVIVGSNEANPSEGKISNESMVGKALLGKRVGDKVSVITPAKEVTYEIISIA